jgi:dihydrofolate reductase
MRKLMYSMGVSLDGYIAAPRDDLGWSEPDEELHWFYNEQARRSGGSLYGRKLYETMASYWPTADQRPGAPPVEVDFARIWKAMPKVVFSATLDAVGWNSRLVPTNRDDDVIAEVRRLKQDPGNDLDIGGATLAAPIVRAGLVDEFHVAVHPVVLGGGTPFFPLLERRIALRRIETREFASATFLRYEVRR